MKKLTGLFLVLALILCAAFAAAEPKAIDGVTMSAEMAVPESFKTPTFNFAVFHESNILLTDRREGCTRPRR